MSLVITLSFPCVAPKKLSILLRLHDRASSTHVGTSEVTVTEVSRLGKIQIQMQAAACSLTQDILRNLTLINLSAKFYNFILER